jgi:hypothetical protein
MPRHGKSLGGQKHAFIPKMINKKKVDPNSQESRDFFLDEEKGGGRPG